MSAMPAWGKTLEDAEIWDIVAFVRKIPNMTAEDYQQLLQRP
jgi:mono/diheme cytochrome c family protein